jgi:hypothetical protein
MTKAGKKNARWVIVLGCKVPHPVDATRARSPAGRTGTCKLEIYIPCFRFFFFFFLLLVLLSFCYQGTARVGKPRNPTRAASSVGDYSQFVAWNALLSRPKPGTDDKRGEGVRLERHRQLGGRENSIVVTLDQVARSLECSCWAARTMFLHS